MKVAINGGDATRVLSAPNGATVAAIDAQGAWLLGQHGALFCDQSVTSVRAIRVHSAVALNASNIYWLDEGGYGARVMTAPLTGSDPATLSILFEKLPDLSSRLLAPTKVAVDSASVYVISAESRYRVISRDISIEHGFSVMTVPVTGGHPTILAWYFAEDAYEHSPGGIAVDATSVYYSDAGAGTILKMTPK